MSRLSWLVGLLGVLLLATICLSVLNEQRSAALAADDPADLLKRIETLEARVTFLELQLLQGARGLPLTAVPALRVPKHWSKREFNGSPVYIIPLGDADAVAKGGERAARSTVELDGERRGRE